MFNLVTSRLPGSLKRNWDILNRVVITKNHYSTTSTTSGSVNINSNSNNDNGTLDYIYSKKGQPYELVVGVEVHSQIKSKEKLFSSSLNIGSLGDSIANERVSYVDAAFPGTLPVINDTCVRQAIKTGLALGSTINKYSYFDRKHYFYQDLPQGYQITQYQNPIVSKGNMILKLKANRNVNINISHIQLEQDSGKSIHDQSTSTLVDLNRAGVGLMEIVSGADFRSSEQVGVYIKQLQRLLKHIGTSDANMQQGEMRCDINISVRKAGDETLGTRVELKNMISIKSIVGAIDAEATRQIEILEDGGRIQRETRGFDLEAGQTFHMRSKEDETDYRFFPDPDLPPLILTDDYIKEVQQTLGELPDEMKERIKSQYGLNEDDAVILVDNIDNVVFLESVLKYGKSKKDIESGNIRPIKKVLPWVLKEIFEWMNVNLATIKECPITIEKMAMFLDLIESGYISSRTGKEIIAIMLQGKDQRTPKEIVDSLGLSQISDDSMLDALCKELVEKHQDKVQEIKSGKPRLYKFFVGEVMKQTKGRSNPEKVNQYLKKYIGHFDDN